MNYWTLYAFIAVVSGVSYMAGYFRWSTWLAVPIGFAAMLVALKVAR
jgi:hypothetical protein